MSILYQMRWVRKLIGGTFYRAQFYYDEYCCAVYIKWYRDEKDIPSDCLRYHSFNY